MPIAARSFGSSLAITTLLLAVFVLVASSNSPAQRYDYDCREDLPAGSLSVGFVMSDLDDDGDDDIASVGFESTYLLVFENMGSYFNHIPDSISLGSETAWTVDDVDFDNDGDVDLLVGYYLDHGRVQAFWNDGTGSFSSGPDVTLGDSASSPIVTYIRRNDFDGDGAEEVVATVSDLNSATKVGLFYLKYNDSTSSIEATTLRDDYARLNQFHPYHIHIGDLNTDSKPDIAVTAADMIELWYNTGDSIPFSRDPSNYDSVYFGQHLREIDIAHFDTGSTWDLVVSDYTSGVYVLLNSDTTYDLSEPTFIDTVVVEDTLTNISDLAVAGFFDDVHDTDLAVMHELPNRRILMYKNTGGAGIFTRQDDVVISDSNANPYWLKAAEINGGDDFELIYSDGYLKRIVVLTNDGECGDLNHDGAIDAADLTIMVNGWLYNEPYCPLWSDVNGDGTPLNASDYNHMVQYLFFNGPPPDSTCGF